MDKRTKSYLLAIILIGLVLRILYAILIYEPSLLAYHFGDYTLYRVGGESIVNGDWLFTNSLFLVRPPAFPLMIALLGVNEFLILGVNILFGVLVIPLTYILASDIGLAEKWALLAALVISLDPTSIKFSGVLLPEPLANLTLLLFYIFLWRFSTIKSSFKIAILLAVILLISAYTRPAPYLLWIPMGIWLFAQRDISRLAIVIFMCISLIGVSIWNIHNRVYFNNSSFTSIGTYNLLYYRALSVDYQFSGKSIEQTYIDLATRVEEKLNHDTSTVTADTRHRHLSTTSEVQSAMVSVAIETFLDRPLIYLITIPIGIYRILFRVETFSVLEPITLLWNIIFVGVGILGVLKLLFLRMWKHASFLTILAGYFIAGTLLVQTSGIDTRARTMITPLMAIACCYGLQVIGNYYMQWKEHREHSTAKL